MENSHERLEKLINYFAKTPANAEPLFITDIDTYKNLFIQETMNIRTYLNRKSLPIENERNFELLVHEYQSLITFWLDKLVDEHDKSKCRYPKPVYELITAELQKLLTFIHHRYARFFNLDEKVPEISLKQIRAELKGSVQNLRGHLVKESSNETLTELALSPLNHFLNDERKKKITYRYLFYSRRVEEALAGFSNEKYTGAGCDDKPLIELLVFMNYNNSEATHFIINKIISNIEMATGPQSKVNKLRFFLKEFNQFKERPDVACRRNYPSLKEQIVGWISEEIAYHVKSSSLLAENADGEETQLINGEKLQFSISVDVLGIIFRAAKDNNVITNKHKTEVFKNISRHIRTSQAETVSVNSLIKKSYVAERRAKDTAVDVLHGLIKKIHQY